MKIEEIQLTPELMRAFLAVALKLNGGAMIIGKDDPMLTGMSEGVFKLTVTDGQYAKLEIIEKGDKS